MFDGKRLIDRKRADTIVQSDLKLWPFEELSGARNTPMIQVQFHGGGEQVPPRGGFVHGSHQDERDFFLGTKVMTVLAYFNDSQRQAIQYAGSTSGIECCAFRTHRLWWRLRTDWTTKAMENATCDMGGGTFDVSLLAIEDATSKLDFLHAEHRTETPRAAVVAMEKTICP